MSKFKVGDTVRMEYHTRYAKDTLYLLYGRVGHITYIDSSDSILPYKVKFDGIGRALWISGKDLKKEGE